MPARESCRAKLLVIMRLIRYSCVVSCDALRHYIVCSKRRQCLAWNRPVERRLWKKGVELKSPIKALQWFV